MSLDRDGWRAKLSRIDGFTPAAVEDALDDLERFGFVELAGPLVRTGEWVSELGLAGMAAEHLDGVPWYKAKVHRRWQRHRAHSRAFLDGRYIERCSCGAYGPAPWYRLDRWPSRASRLARTA